MCFVADLPTHDDPDYLGENQDIPKEENNQSPQAKQFLSELVTKHPSVFQDDLPDELPPERAI